MMKRRIPPLRTSSRQMAPALAWMIIGLMVLAAINDFIITYPITTFLSCLFIIWLLFIGAALSWYRRGEEAGYQKQVDHEAIYQQELTAQVAALRQQKQATKSPLASVNIDKLDPKKFEEHVEAVFQKLGYRTQQSGHTNQPDGGVDIRAWRGNEYIVIQCKKVSSPVGSPMVRDLLGVVTKEQAHKGILVSTGGYSSHAKTFAQGSPLELWEKSDLIRHAR
jgi:predicted Mrr-cat superfamily restriction endonuclease